MDQFARKLLYYDGRMKDEMMNVANMSIHTSEMRVKHEIGGDIVRAGLDVDQLNMNVKRLSSLLLCAN
jgi:hypothetical protein